ncbi:MAG: hypothetical protein ABIQ18_00100 [Umezawaea sp.]
MDLDDELRRLFQDQRLDIPVRPGADEALVTGARRVRRRRIALASAGSTFAVAALVAGGIALSGLGGASSMPPAGPPAVSSTVTAEPKATSDTVGYGVLKLGMSEADAVATGFLTRGPDDALGCHTYFTQGHPQLVGAVVVSPTTGVLRITLPADAKTSMGIGVGSTFAELKARYPRGYQLLPGLSYVVPSDPQWRYLFIVDGMQDSDKVTAIRMELVDPECVLT